MFTGFDLLLFLYFSLAAKSIFGGKETEHKIIVNNKIQKGKQQQKGYKNNATNSTVKLKLKHKSVGTGWVLDNARTLKMSAKM